MSFLAPESESDVRRGLAETLRDLHHHVVHIETSTQGAGAPDVNSALGNMEWHFECKLIKNLAKKCWSRDAPIRLTDRQMRPSQRVWHAKRWHAGNTRSFYYVVLWEPSMVTISKHLWLLLPGGPTAEFFGRTWRMSDLKHHALLRSPTRPTSKELAACLH